MYMHVSVFVNMCVDKIEIVVVNLMGFFFPVLSLIQSQRLSTSSNERVQERLVIC